MGICYSLAKLLHRPLSGVVSESAAAWPGPLPANDRIEASPARLLTALRMSIGQARCRLFHRTISRPVIGKYRAGRACTSLKPIGENEGHREALGCVSSFR